MAQQERFDWWAAEPAGRTATTAAGRTGGRVSAAAAPAAARQATAVGRADPCDRAVAAVPANPARPPVAVSAPAGPAVPARAATPAGPAAPAGPHAGVEAGQVYRAVQQSPAFREIRRGYRGFAFPATGIFLGWYLLYVLAQAAAPGLMRVRLAGPVNVAWLLGLLQFASTFALTWLYARNARTKRDRAALELRWDTQDQLR
ncbi:DUF485 domain-containing protein [Kitasatospora sp. NPDC088346]|uniref:DUF485 domain-containing protein n=1 Tax=Kitasatospora sp. NPDC088346 TaxID=3364073 RepID=UPI00380D9983